ncbi:MAG: YihA family ribosome biogenesis GTP-binding protein [Cryomorphaceae bacterium]|nr:YihA family ribosome biogenesis GTP-binding protein [Cryomorphaceae bacterium]
MEIKQVEFVKSSTNLKQCPTADKPEFAFIGRSNVGKSSLINLLCNRNKLAKISTRPGKTQLLNHFLVNEAWYLVDLPGYGYAKVSKGQRKIFKGMMLNYLEGRRTLLCTFVLIDSRLSPQQVDLDFIQWMGEKGLPFALVFTKTDKLGKNQVQSNIALFRKTLIKDWEELPPIFLTSAFKKEGRDELLAYIGEVFSALND